MVICTVAIGGWYPRGAARMIEEFSRVSSGYEIQAHVNVLPAGAPAGVIENGYDYTGYCAKPFAAKAAWDSGADIAILMDAAFYPIRRINPLVEHIARVGYFLCRNGYKVGEWASDRALERMGLTRDEAFRMEEVSSYCVGFNFNRPESGALLDKWCDLAADRLTFPGPHTNIGHSGRNHGFASADNRVRGHRHDQTALSVTAHRLGMNQLVERPRFTAYRAYAAPETLLVNEGGM